IDGANTFLDLGAPISVAAVAGATYQGDFHADPDFQLVVDRGANTYDPDTIYISDGRQIAVTKDHGQSWVLRPGPFSAVNDLEVDPANRDTVYVVQNSFGVGKIY